MDDVKREKMKDIKLIGKNIENIEDFSHYQKLEKVDFSKNLIEDPSPLRKCRKISWLNMSNNKITTIDFVCGLKNLSVLNLGYNQVRDMSSVAALKHLKALILNNNNICQVHGLDSLPQLTSLVLSNNSIKEVDVSCLGSLKKLQLSHNQIEEFPNIKFNIELTSISLNDNSIKRIPEDTVSEESRLEIVDLGKNNISKFKHIKTLTAARHIKRFNLHGNDVTQNADYHHRILKMFPGLKNLDSQCVDKMTKPEDTSDKNHNAVGKGEKKQKKRAAITDLPTSEDEATPTKKKKMDFVATDNKEEVERVHKVKKKKQNAVKDKKDYSTTSTKSSFMQSAELEQSDIHKPKGKKKHCDPHLSSGVLEIKDMRTKGKQKNEDVFAAFKSAIGTGMDSSW